MVSFRGAIATLAAAFATRRSSFFHEANAFSSTNVHTSPLRTPSRLSRNVAPSSSSVLTRSSPRIPPSTALNVEGSSSSSRTTDVLNANSRSEVVRGESDVVVVGAGPAGLLTAIMLSRKYPDKIVNVFDRLAPPPSPTDPDVWSDVAKFYLIGLGSRGQTALKQYGVWDDVEAVCTTVLGRKDWSPESDEGIERIFTDRPVKTQVLPRDKLVGVLHEHVSKRYAGKIILNYGYEVTPEDFAADGNTKVTVRVSKCGEDVTSSDSPRTPASNDVLCDVDDDESLTLSTELLIAADGTSRTVANAMEREDRRDYRNRNAFGKLFGGKPFTVKRYVDDNRRVYKTVPMKIPSDWRPDLNYSARTRDGRINYDALPADGDGNYCGVLLVREDDEFAGAGADPDGLRRLLDETLPQFSVLLDDGVVEGIAKKPPSFLPSFRYAGPRLYRGDRTLILGDCAHTVKPYFGLGANSALEDVQFLEAALDETDTVPEAVRHFSQARAAESEALVKLSRALDRPGKLGFLTFVLPLIMDSIFHGMLPKVFAPNTIALLQKEGITFRGVRRRKRFDRLGQVGLLGVVGYGFTFALGTGVRKVAVLTGKKASTVTGLFVASGLLLGLLKRSKFFFNDNLSPADVIAKNNDEVVEGDTIVSTS